MDNQFPDISVIIATYNHEHTVVQSLNSILSQECSYTYEIIVGDDFSSDNTVQVLKKMANKYPEKIRLFVNNSNVGLVKNYFSLVSRCKGKYIAQCAGDDFWSDNRKLEKQCSYLENHPETGIVHSDYHALIEKHNKTIFNFQKHHQRNFTTINSFFDLLLQGPFSPLTVMFRRTLINDYIKDINPVSKKWMIEDYPFWIYLSHKTRIDYMPESTATYRITAGTITRNENVEKKINFIRNTFLIEIFFIKHFLSDSITTKLVLKKYHRKNITLAWLSKNKKRSTISFLYLKQTGELSKLDRIYHFLTLCKFADSIFRSLRKIKIKSRNW